jgi:hypothetical protein
MPNYTTLEEMKSRLGSISDDLDVVLTAAIDAAETAIEDVCGRPFTLAASATPRVFRGLGAYVRVDDISSATGLIVTDIFQTFTQYQLEPLNALGPGRRYHPYTLIRLATGFYFAPPIYYGQATVTVTAFWGWTTVPNPVKEATRILAADLFHMKDNQFGVAGFGELGVVMVRENKTVVGLLKNYRRGEHAYAMA